MNRDLILVCDRCGKEAGWWATPVIPWAECCGEVMRLANTTDRDGNQIERAKAIHPANGPEARP